MWDTERLTDVERGLSTHVAEWLERKPGKPLVIRGARQVGKSHLVRTVARQRGLALAEVNLEQHAELSKVFESLDVPAILRELEAVARVPLAGSDTLLFLDEIQAVPAALVALRYLYEQGPSSLPVVAAGSLLETALSAHRLSMPVGRVEHLYLGPLGFGEFLRGLGEDYASNALASFTLQRPWPTALHRRLLQRQREVLCVGGMPEAVARYCANGSLAEVARVQRTLIAAYKDDFGRYGASPAARRQLQAVFTHVPSTLGRKVNRNAPCGGAAHLAAPSHHCAPQGPPVGSAVP